MKIFNFTSFKSFGDLVIAVTSIERVVVEQRTSVKVLLGSHLSDLIDAINPVIRSEVVVVGEPHVPSLFDTKRNGIFRAIRSGITIRKSMGRRAASSEEFLVFDSLGMRERFVAARSRALALPHTDNIYLSYERFLLNAGFELAPGRHLERKKIVICGHLSGKSGLDEKSSRERYR